LGDIVVALHVISTYEALRAVLCRDFGPGQWSRIGTEQVRLFERVRRAGSFGTGEEDGSDPGRAPDADGLLLLSLLGGLRARIDSLQFRFPSRMTVFYGFDNIRFSDPVPVPARVRLHLTVVDAALRGPEIIRVAYRHRLEIPGGRIVLSADAINQIYLNEPSS
jgi:hypothetical protein